MIKKYLKIILVIIFIFIIMSISSFLKEKNLIFMNETEKNQLLKSLKLKENTESFQPINFIKKRTEVGNAERVKVIKFNISKEDYKENELKYENNSALLDRELIVDRGDYFECELQISNYNKKYDYENIKPKSENNEKISNMLRFFSNIYIIIVIMFAMCKKDSSVKVLNILLGIIVILMIIAIIYVCNVINLI